MGDDANWWHSWSRTPTSATGTPREMPLVSRPVCRSVGRSVRQERRRRRSDTPILAPITSALRSLGRTALSELPISWPAFPFWCCPATYLWPMNQSLTDWPPAIPGEAAIADSPAPSGTPFASECLLTHRYRRRSTRAALAAAHQPHSRCTAATHTAVSGQPAADIGPAVHGGVR